MAKTSIVSAATLTTSYNDNRVRVRVGTGEIGYMISYTAGSSTSMEVRIEVSHLDSPDVTNDAHWYTPSTEAGAAAATTVISLAAAAAGRRFIDLSTAFSGATAGNSVFNRVPTGVPWVRVSAKVTGTATGNVVSVDLLHNPVYGSTL